MAMDRTFLGWDRPALVSAADWLIDRYAADGAVDLGGVVVVTPGRRAGRRLVELLLAGAEEKGLLLSPPRQATPGTLASVVCRFDEAIATGVERRLAWVGALRARGAGELGAFLPKPPDGDDWGAWAALADRLDNLHMELAGERLTFGDVARLGQNMADFNESDRWGAMERVRADAVARLRDAGRVEQNAARWDAIDHKRFDETARSVVLVGVVEPGATMRALVEAMGDRVTPLVFAPADLADRFDAIGGLKAEAWCEATVVIEDETIDVADQPSDQADAVVRAVASAGGRYAADDIVIGVPDVKLVPLIGQHLSLMGVDSRYVEGRPMRQAAPCRLLAACVSHLEDGRFSTLAALLRHADVEALLSGELEADEAAADWQTLADEVHTRHLQRRPIRDWLERADRRGRLARVYQAVHDWLEPLRGGAKPAGAWAQPILDVLRGAYGSLELDTRVDWQREAAEALGALCGAAGQMRDAAERLTQAEPISGADALRTVLQLADEKPLIAPADSAALEMLGWLELALDDAPMAVVASMHEGAVPESVVDDAFLPDGLRRTLGLMDNERRLARDAYLLASMAATKQRLHLIAGRSGADGQPAAPSRLLMTGGAGEVVRRVNRVLADQPPRVSCASVRLGSTDDSVFAAEHWPPRPDLTGWQPMTALPVTAFRDYLACPYRFYLKHVLKLRELGDGAVEMDAAAFGSMAHRVLAEMGTASIAGDLDCGDEAGLREWLLDRLDRAFNITYGGEPIRTLLIQREQLRVRLGEFARWQAKWRADGWRIESVELEVNDATVDVDGEPFGLRGRIDRIDIHPETGRRVLFDYKTGDKGRSPEQTHRRGRQDARQWIDLQLPLYRRLASAAGLEPITDTGYIVLPKQRRGIYDLMGSWDELALQEADETARDVVRQIRDGVFYPPSGGVTYDDYAVICGTARTLAGAVVDAMEAGEDG